MAETTCGLDADCIAGINHRGDCRFPSYTDGATQSCPCECHKAKHEARKPHPDTMAGRP